MVVLSRFPPPTDGIKLEQPSTTVHINSKDVGKGTLYITESCLSWVNSSSGQGFSMEYPHIALHAVSRDLRAYPHECLYMMIDAHMDDPENRLENGDSGDEEESDSEMTEMRFIPDDKGMLDAMFHAMSECQSLHPDPQDSLSDDEEEIFEDADQGEYDLGAGDATMNQTVGNHGTIANGAGGELMDMDVGQFDDADNEPEN